MVLTLEQYRISFPFSFASQVRTTYLRLFVKVLVNAEGLT